MSKVTIHAGDFLPGKGEFSSGSFMLKTEARSFMGEIIPVKQLASVEIASEENVKKMLGTIGWGAVGALFGPIGLLAGVLAGGRKKEVTFTAKFKDGRKLLATTDGDTFIKLQAAVF